MYSTMGPTVCKKHPGQNDCTTLLIDTKIKIQSLGSIPVPVKENEGFPVSVLSNNSVSPEESYLYKRRLSPLGANGRSLLPLSGTGLDEGCMFSGEQRVL